MVQITSWSIGMFLHSPSFFFFLERRGKRGAVFQEVKRGRANKKIKKTFMVEKFVDLVSLVQKKKERMKSCDYLPVLKEMGKPSSNPPPPEEQTKR